jgi:hypothetical protein
MKHLFTLLFALMALTASAQFVNPDDVTYSGFNDFTDTLKVSGVLQLPTNAAPGRVWISDAYGNGSWQNIGVSQYFDTINSIYALVVSDSLRNFGIGTHAPDARLTVHGSFKARFVSVFGDTFNYGLFDSLTTIFGHQVNGSGFYSGTNPLNHWSVFSGILDFSPFGGQKHTFAAGCFNFNTGKANAFYADSSNSRINSGDAEYIFDSPGLKMDNNYIISKYGGSNGQVMTYDGSANATYWSNPAIAYSAWDTLPGAIIEGDTTRLVGIGTKAPTSQLGIGALFNGTYTVLQTNTQTSAVAPPDFDITAYTNPFSPPSQLSWVVTISAQAPDAFDWADGNGNSGTGVIIDGTKQLLSYGTTVYFKHAGYDIGEVFNLRTEPSTFDMINCVMLNSYSSFKVDGNANISIGQGANSVGYANLNLGPNDIDGEATIAMGSGNIVTDRNKQVGVFGQQNKISGTSAYSFAFGAFNIINNNPNDFVIGYANDTNNINLTPRLFEIGNGQIFGGPGRSNVMTVLFDGRVGLGTVAPDALLDVRGSFKLVDGSQSAGYVLTSDVNGLANWQPSNPWKLGGNALGVNNAGYFGTLDSSTIVTTTNGIPVGIDDGITIGRWTKGDIEGRESGLYAYNEPVTMQQGFKGTVRQLLTPVFDGTGLDNLKANNPMGAPPAQLDTATYVVTVIDTGSYWVVNTQYRNDSIFTNGEAITITSTGAVGTWYSYPSYTNGSTPGINYNEGIIVFTTAQISAMGSTDTIIGTNNDTIVLGGVRLQTDILKIEGDCGIMDSTSSSASVFHSCYGQTFYFQGIGKKGHTIGDKWTVKLANSHADGIKITYTDATSYEHSVKVGVNTPTPNSTLQVSGSLSLSFRIVSVDTILTQSDYALECTSGVNVTLPDVSVCGGRIYVIKNTSLSNVTLLGYSGGGSGLPQDIIDGTTSRTILPSSNLTVQSFGTHWNIE